MMLESLHVESQYMHILWDIPSSFLKLMLQASNHFCILWCHQQRTVRSVAAWQLSRQVDTAPFKGQAGMYLCWFPSWLMNTLQGSTCNCLHSVQMRNMLSLKLRNRFLSIGLDDHSPVLRYIQALTFLKHKTACKICLHQLCHKNCSTPSYCSWLLWCGLWPSHAEENLPYEFSSMCAPSRVCHSFACWWVFYESIVLSLRY